MAWLTYTDAHGAPADFPLERDRTSIGRSTESDLVLADPSVSRSHAALLRRDGRFVLVDQESSLGVVVNGQATREHVLEDGDRILLGRQALCFRDPASLAVLTSSESDDEAGGDAFAWLPNLGPVREAVAALAGSNAAIPEVGNLQRAVAELTEDLGRARHQHETLVTLLRVSRLIHTVPELDRLLTLVVELGAKVLGAERGFLMLVDPATGELRSGASYNMQPADHASGTISHGIAGQVLADGRAAWSDDAGADPRFRTRRSVLDLGIRSVLCAPLRRRGSPAQGVLYLDRLQSDARFTPTDVESLSGLANIASSAIETARLKREEARRVRAEEELRHARELDGLKADFLSMISHDLRTPLTSIKSWAEILLDDWENLAAGERHRYLGIVNQECDRLTRLIDDLLDLQRMEAGRMDIQAHPCDAEGMIRQAAETYRAAAQSKGIALSWSCDPGLPQVLADPERIAQVLANLIGNALKFTPPNGKLRLSARGATSIDPDAMEGKTVTIDLRAAARTRFIRFSVADTGEGIPPQMQRRIFDRFRQVDAAQAGRPKGSGLGLSICREIVERHGGSIAVESQLGRGSTFSFLLPASLTEV